MKLKKINEYNIIFSVESFWPEEGGMGSDSFGKPVKSIEEAVHLHDLATASKPETKWIIVGCVQRYTKRK